MPQLTEQQIEQYRRDGFLIVEKLIEPAQAQALLERYEAIFERAEYETGVRPDEVNLPQGDPPFTRQICNGWKSDLTVARTILTAEMGENLARLGGWEGARVMIDNLLWKPPHGRSIGFHQDSMYSLWVNKPAMTSCWIALEQTNAQGGTLIYVRGSHKWGEARPILKFHGPEDDMAEVREWAEQNKLEIDLVPVVVPQGGGAFHDGWLWHGSRVNLTDKPRRALAIHSFQADVCFAPENMKVGNGPIYGRYKKLGSNDVDEGQFPIIWSRNGHRTAGLDQYLAHGWDGA
jgi:ectoine hydroxylase-related dioxygenase (phytanoyl-CoA dioxygenase family)